MFSNALLRKFLHNTFNQYLALFIESSLLTLLAICLSQILYPQESGIVSLFFLSIMLQQCMHDILEENRTGIYEKRLPSLKVNSTTALQISVIFAGIFFAYFIISLFLSKELAFHLFKKQLSIAQINPQDVLSSDFGSFLSLVKHNVIILLLVLLFSFFFQHLGAMFVLGLNASIWGVVLSIIEHNTAQQFCSLSYGYNLLFITTATMSILPHLLLEAVGYIIASMAGIFLSLACMKYKITSSEFNRVISTCIRLLGTAILFIMIAAYSEVRFPKVLVWFFSS